MPSAVVIIDTQSHTAVPLWVSTHSCGLNTSGIVASVSSHKHPTVSEKRVPCGTRRVLRVHIVHIGLVIGRESDATVCHRIHRDEQPVLHESPCLRHERRRDGLHCGSHCGSTTKVFRKEVHARSGVRGVTLQHTVERVHPLLLDCFVKAVLREVGGIEVPPLVIAAPQRTHCLGNVLVRERHGKVHAERVREVDVRDRHGIGVEHGSLALTHNHFILVQPINGVRCQAVLRHPPLDVALGSGAETRTATLRFGADLRTAALAERDVNPQTVGQCGRVERVRSVRHGRTGGTANGCGR